MLAQFPCFCMSISCKGAVYLYILSIGTNCHVISNYTDRTNDASSKPFTFHVELDNLAEAPIFTYKEIKDAKITVRIVAIFK